MTSLTSLIPGVSQAKTIFYVILVTAIISIAGMAVWHYNSVISQLATEKANNQKLKDAIDTQDATIKKAVVTISKWKEAQEQLTKDIATMAQVSKEAQSTSEKLNETFAKHDLTKLSLDKPGAIEIRINHGTDNAMQLLECVSDPDSTQCGSRLRPATGKGTASQTSKDKNVAGSLESNNPQ